MNITDVRVRLMDKADSNMKAVASITIDGEFVVHDIKVIQGNDKLFIAMPSKKDGNGDFKDIAHPINTATRTKIQETVLAKYEEVISNTEEYSTYNADTPALISRCVFYLRRIL